MLENFPISENMQWHSGFHWLFEKFYHISFPCKIIALRNEKEIFYPKLESNILKKDLRELDAEDLKCIEQFYDKNDLLSISLKKLNEQNNKYVLNLIKLSASVNFKLFKHEIHISENDIFTFYSLIMHLSEDTLLKQTGDLYENKLEKLGYTYYFPSDKIGYPSISEANQHILHIEYFITQKYNFPQNIFYLQERSCISKGTDLFSLEYVEVSEENLYNQTVCSVTELPNNSKLVQLSVEKSPMYIDQKQLSKEGYKCEYHEIKNEDGKIEKITIKITKNTENTGEEYQEKIAIPLILDNIHRSYFLKDIEIIYKELYDESEEIWVLVKEDKLNTKSFTTKLDSKKKKKRSDKSIIVKGNDTNNITKKRISVYITKMTKLNTNMDEDEIIFSSLCETIIINGNKFIKIPNKDNQYVRESDIIKKADNTWQDFFDIPIIENIDLSNFRKNYEHKNQFTDFLNENNEIYRNSNDKELSHFAYKHESEWKKQEKSDFSMFSYASEHFQLNSKSAIWDSNGKNKNFSFPLNDCNNLIFFYVPYFEEHLRKIHQGYAAKLIAVQNKIMKNWDYVQGNCGLYNEIYDKTKVSKDTQTFCNHAVFETIIKVDGNFTNFTGKVKSTNNFELNPKNEKFPECPNPKTYIYKASNYWCDILKEQSENSSKTGIYTISAEQAFYMAQLGYVVVACWKNEKGKNENNNEPHYVTILPFQNSKNFVSQDQIKVAHVGRGINKEMSLKKAFDKSGNVKKKSCNEVLFYCNIKQWFI